MNADESNTPKPDVESLVKPQEQSSIVEIVQNSIVEPENQSSIIEPQENSVIEPENQSSIIEPQENSVIEPENQSSIVELQENSEDSAIEFLAELEQQLSKDEAEQLNIQEQALVAAQRVAQLQSQEQTLRQEIATLEANYKDLSKQVAQTQTTMGRVVQEALVELEQRKQSLQLAVEQLERRQERIRAEMRTSFAGTSQELAIRVQGFKDYLTGSLQDLAAAAEQLELTPKAKPVEVEKPVVKSKQAETPSTPQFAEQRFQSTTKQVRRLIDEYRTKPDYYGPPWQLRRTFEPVHAERVSNWFFTQGGRGALRSMGSRLQNILISSAVISILYTLYENRLRTLILSNTPERLGEWRRGLQDCLGISRGDFGPERGVVLFETAEAVAAKAERLVKTNQMPLIIIDDSEDQISLSLLQFPLLLAFAPDPRMSRDSRDYDY
ncbi:MAG: DUF3086 domain-containing protein [Gloeocapsa sp. UFS-A4-WI-NPMV-4B04]|jgi:hypothetical protein|nr:DUF3086 domain-containing protein [Gloeocapsa sp. UFS-A4-WI-NPMV-4B04]